MISIKPEILAKIRAAKKVADLHEMVADAVLLELATLPAYFTAAFSLMPGANNDSRALIVSVAYEEMLHMTLACNLLISIGGNPSIKKDGLALKYPTPLPLGVDKGVIVSLNAATKKQIYDVCMGIERPYTKAPLPGEEQVHSHVTQAVKKGYPSIGEFYDAILDKLQEFVDAGKDPYAHPRLEQQVDIRDWFPPAVNGDASGKVNSMETAREVVNTIISQGEGVDVGESPIDPYGGLEGSFAHFFKFGEVFHGKRLVPDAKAPSGWSYSGAPVELDEKSVYKFLPNAKLSDYPAGSAAAITGQAFYNTYVRLLTCLDDAFNGTPSRMRDAIGLMYELKLAGLKVVRNPADPTKPKGYVAAPPFMLGKVGASASGTAAKKVVKK